MSGLHVRTKKYTSPSLHLDDDRVAVVIQWRTDDGLQSRIKLSPGIYSQSQLAEIIPHLQSFVEHGTFMETEE